jgi:hypothetical protein
VRGLRLKDASVTVDGEARMFTVEAADRRRPLRIFRPPPDGEPVEARSLGRFFVCP